MRDRDEFVVESITDHTGNPKKKSSLLFRVHFVDYPEAEDSWLPWKEVNELEALDVYLGLT